MSASKRFGRVAMVADRTATRRRTLPARCCHIAVVAFAASAMASPAAFAQEMPVSQLLQVESTAGSAHSAPARRLALRYAAPLSAEALSSHRGGDAGTSAVQLNGSVSDNRAVNVATGGNTMSSGALAGASGVPVVIQNSGNNVLIQSATIVNVVIK